MRPRLSVTALLFFSLSACVSWGDACVSFEGDVPPQPLACECRSDLDCWDATPDDALRIGVVCNAPDGCGECVLSGRCIDDTSCFAEESCDLERGRCEVPLVCDGADPIAGCPAGEQCLVLDAAGCRAPIPATTCRFEPPIQTVAAGLVSVGLVAYDNNGALVAADGTGVTVAGAAVAPGASRDEFVVDAPCPGPERCSVIVDAVVGAARCSGQLTVLPALARGDARVIVHGIDDGMPVAGAFVVIDEGGSVVTGTTDDAGMLSAPGMADLDGGRLDRVSVFADGHESETCLSCAPDHVVGLRRHVPRDLTPAIAGRLTNIDRIAHAIDGADVDIRMGLAGLALSSPDFEAHELFGVPGSQGFFISGISQPGDRIAFTSGGTLTFGTAVIRDRFEAFGRPGVQSLWAIGANSRLAAFATLAQPNVDMRLESMRAMGRDAQSGFVGTVAATPAARPRDVDAPLEDLLVAGDVDVLTDVDTSAEVLVTVPGPLPPRTTDLLFGVAAIVPGDGAVLLGGAVVTTTQPTADGGVERAVTPPLVTVTFAPPHDGLEGRALVLFAVAVDVDELIADDVLSQSRVSMPLLAPAPGRTLAVTLPTFPTAPVTRQIFSAVTVEEVDASTLVIVAMRSDGIRHTVRANGVVPGDVVDLRTAIADALTARAQLGVAETDVRAEDAPLDARRPWAGVRRNAVR